LYGRIEAAIPGRLRQQMFGYKVHKLASVASSQNPLEMYHRLASHWLDASSVVIGAGNPETAVTRDGRSGALGVTERMMYLDLVTYLPDDILTKLDRASMAVSLEARVPLLDHRVVEFAWRLPISFKLRDGQSKWLLRQVLYRYVPREMIERPKAGFGIPLDSWLRGPLRDWAEALLDERRLRDEGFFRPEPIRQKWAQHLSGKASWQYHLWDVLMFQAWLEKEKSAGSIAPAEALGNLGATTPA
jgi:asparagine synthase (glutamine-hydrolysing)